MKSPVLFRRWGQFVCAGLTVLLLQTRGFSVPIDIFFTQFEPGEGYSTAFELAGQNAWTSDYSGGNGIVSNYITGQGQQAYIGSWPPASGDDQLVVWRPIHFNPLAVGMPLVKFSVLMSIVDSTLTNGHYDNFRWSVYNSQGDRLFSLDFDNQYTDVNYLLDGTNTLFLTGLRYTNSENYTLTVTMDFASNRWNATLNQALIATNQPITTTNAPLNLGDVDAVWLIRTNGLPGDNYLLFDNYRVTAELLPARVQLLSRTSQGWALLRVSGQNGSRWSLEATTNFLSWTALETNVISGTSFDHIDTTAPPFSRRFYRARWVP